MKMTWRNLFRGVGARMSWFLFCGAISAALGCGLVTVRNPEASIAAPAYGETLQGVAGAAEPTSERTSSFETSPTPTDSSAVNAFPPVPSSPSPTPIACPGSLPSRLMRGEYAYVLPEPPLANRIRSGPGRDFPVVGRAELGEVMELEEGPVCADAWAWWRVRLLDTGVSGWTAEGDSNAYWLGPCETGEACP